MLIVILRRALQILALLVLGLIASWSFATTYTVSSNADTNTAGTLRYAINQINSSGTTGSVAANNVINFNSGLGTITLTANLPVIQNGTTINGPSGGQTINGANDFRILATFNSSLSVSNLTLQDGMAQGGSGFSGGGGGLGAGGGIYVDYGQTLAISNTTIQNCFAQGGNGTSGYSGAGGGASWSSSASSNATSNSTGGGDYPGNGVSGGPAAYSGTLSGYGGGTGGSGTGSGTAGTGGGDGAGSPASTDNGGNGGYCGGGGGASDSTNNSAGGGGGNGGEAGSAGLFNGGGGGGYGSGGAGVVGTSAFGGGGGGGFGGGGGAGTAASSGNVDGGGGGGWGGGGGAGSAGGSGGNFGGAGVANNYGGGGAGIGGAIFVGDSAILQIGDSFTSTSNGTNGGTGGNSGQGYANDVFLFQDAQLQFVGSSSQTVAFAIQADTNATAANYDAGVLINVASGAAITMNANANTYQGGTTIQSGTLVVATGTLPTIGDVNINFGTTLTLEANSVATTGNFTNNGSLNIQQSTFTPSNYTSFINNAQVFVYGTSSNIGGSVTAGGSLNIGINSAATASANAFSTSNSVNFTNTNVYNTSSITVAAGGSITTNLFMLGTATFTTTGGTISGTTLTTGADSFGNKDPLAQFAASQAIATFPTINVEAGTFTTNGFAISGITGSFNTASGTTTTFDNTVGGSGALNNAGTLDIDFANAITGLTGLITNTGAINVLQNLTLNNTVNDSGSIAVSSGMILTSNAALYVYNNAQLAGTINGGIGSTLAVGVDSLGNTYSGTNSTINSNISGIPSIEVSYGAVAFNGTLSGVTTLLDVASSGTASFNGTVYAPIAVTNEGTFNAGATINVNSYTSTGTTGVTITNAATVGLINASGTANFGSSDIIVSSNFNRAVAGNTYPWTIVSAASILPLGEPVTLPQQTIANHWSYSETGTEIMIFLEKGDLTPSNPIIGPVINAMSLNPVDAGQFDIINALGNSLTQDELDTYVNELIPDLNGVIINTRKQDAIFHQVSQRMHAVREKLVYAFPSGIMAGDLINSCKVLWIAPFGSIANQQPFDNNFGYRAYSGGMIFGLDFELSERILIGGAFARSVTNIETKLSPGVKTRTVGYHGLLYGSYIFGRKYDHYLEWMASGAYDINDGNRQILITGNNFSTSSSYFDYQWGLLANYGQNYNYNRFCKFTLLGTAQYNAIITPPYAEYGYSPAALYVDNTRYNNVLMLGVGAKSSLSPVTRWFAGATSFGIILGYDVISTHQNITANFVAGSELFTYVNAPARTSLTFDIDCMLAIDRGQLQISYELQLRNGYIVNGVTAKFRFPF